RLVAVDVLDPQPFQLRRIDLGQVDRRADPAQVDPAPDDPGLPLEENQLGYPSLYGATHEVEVDHFQLVAALAAILHSAHLARRRPGEPLQRPPVDQSS